MGTRATVTIYDDNVDSRLVKIYRQFDGYPDGLGIELAELANKNIVNGFRIGETAETTANGMGCLAAQIVAGLKNELGNVYLTPLNAGGEEYNYELWLEGGVVFMSCPEINFSGPVTEYLEKAQDGTLFGDDEEDGFDPL